MVCQPLEHRGGEQRWRLYPRGCGDGDDQGHINSGFDQIWIGYSDGNCASNGHISLSHLLTFIHPDHAEILLRGHSEGRWELQHICQMVCLPLKHRGGE
jgi:hypothetical protein